MEEEKKLNEDQINEMNESLRDRMQKTVDAEGKGKKVFMADPKDAPAKVSEKVQFHIEIFDKDDGTIGIKNTIEGKREDGKVPPTPAAELGIAIMHRISAAMSAIMKEAHERHKKEMARLQNMSPEEIEKDKRQSKRSKRQKRRSKRG